MNAKNEFIYYETVLSYCLTKIQSNNHDQAMHYGRLSATIDSGSGKWRISDWISEDFAVADVSIAKYLWVLYASTS